MVDMVPLTPEVSDWPPGLQRPIRITSEKGWRDGHQTRAYHAADAANIAFTVCIDPLTQRIIWNGGGGRVCFAAGSLPEQDVRNAVLDFEGASASPIL